MIAGVGKTYRMLQDAREMLRCGTDVQIGYVAMHGRPDTVKALEGLPVIPHKTICKCFISVLFFSQMSLSMFPEKKDAKTAFCV